VKLKRRYAFTRLCGVTFQKTIVFRAANFVPPAKTAAITANNLVFVGQTHKIALNRRTITTVRLRKASKCQLHAAQALSSAQDRLTNDGTRSEVNDVVVGTVRGILIGLLDTSTLFGNVIINYTW
jgi:hypothetical protein